MWIEAIFNAFRRSAAIVAGGSILTLLAVAPLTAASTTVASLPSSPAQGTWRTLNGTEITVEPCAADEYCGRLSWVIVPKINAEQCHAVEKQAFASLMLDYKNPDKALQTRPILGLTMLTLKPTADPTSFTASVYNPQDGSTNDVQVFIMNDGHTLRIGGGCLGTVCVQSQDWPRVPDRANVPDFTCDGGQ